MTNSGPGAESEFALTLSRAIAARGLSLGRLRHHLSRRGRDISVATLSYWSRGVNRPTRAASREALIDLEEILGLGPGELRRALEANPPTMTAAQMHHAGERVDSLVADLGMSWDDGLERVSVHDTVVIGPDRTVRRHTVRETLRALRAGVDRYPVAYDDEDVLPGGALDAVGQANVEVGRVLRSGTSMAVELVLPRELTVGESIMTEHAVLRRGPQRPTNEWWRGVMAPARLVHLSLRFDPADTPLSAVRHVNTGAGSSGETIVITGASVDHFRSDFGPGALGIVWVWGAPARTAPRPPRL